MRNYLMHVSAILTAASMLALSESGIDFVESADGMDVALLIIEGLVAAGTLTLALFTWKLASKTAALAEKTTKVAELTEREVAAVIEQAEVAREAVSVSRATHEGGLRPVLVEVPSGQFLSVLTSGERVKVPGLNATRDYVDLSTLYVQDIEGVALFVSVPFRNAGAGIAFVRSARLSWAEGEGQNVEVEWSTSSLPVNEIVRVSFTLREDRGEPTFGQLMAYSRFTVSVTYSDLAGNVWGSDLAIGLRENNFETAGITLRSEGRIGEVASG
jgi:hypothetical protein